MASEAASLGLELNWQKTKVQALGSREDEPSTIIVQGQGRWLHQLKNLSLDPLSTQRACLNSKALLKSHTAMPSPVQNLDNQMWKTKISSNKPKLYNTWILPIFLCSSQCVAVTKRDAHKVDALGDWCLWKLLTIKWYHHVWNDELRRTTGQPHHSAIVQAWRFSLFDHNARMPDETDAKKS